MITRIELKNFMSHEHTVIEPAAGLTVLVGPNNVGKSAVVAALQILCHNENSTYVMRHGERACSVEIATDDGHAITWRRKNSPSYVVDGQDFDRLKGSGQPDELHRALRLPKVDAGGEADFDIHFGTQKSPIFLLGSSAANAARFFASSSDAHRLVSMQKRHKAKLADAQREKTTLETRSKELNAELDLLEPAIDLDHRLEIVERAYEELLHESDELTAARGLEARLESQSLALASHAARAAALADLPPLPELADVPALAALVSKIATQSAVRDRAEGECRAVADLTNPPSLAPTAALADCIERLTASRQLEQSTSARQAALAPLDSPPALADAAALAALAQAMRHTAEQIERHQRALDALTVMAAPPQSIDTGALSNFVTQFTALAAAVSVHEAHLATACAELDQAASELRALAATSSCALCGSPLDPERVLARAAAGLGGRPHD